MFFVAGHLKDEGCLIQMAHTQLSYFGGLHYCLVIGKMIAI